jgi:biopolymer transport protein ExbD
MNRPRFESINVIPFIDIMLVLLAIVLMTATFISQGLIKVSLPEAKTAQDETQSSQQRVEIAIKDDGSLYYNEEPVDRWTLYVRLDELNREDMIILRADRQSAFEHFIAVVDALKERKLENVSIAADRPLGDTTR